jgi:K+-transporting ATPase ATPase C chain
MSVLMLIVMTIITGLAYPLAITGIAQLIFPHQANGSLIKQGDAVIGSSSISSSRNISIPGPRPPTRARPRRTPQRRPRPPMRRRPSQRRRRPVTTPPTLPGRISPPAARSWWSP